jgi:YfiH family protein
VDSLAIDLGPGVTAVVTTRAGGVSQGPYASLDLALHVGDDPDLVRVNRARLASRLDLPVAYVNQVHGAQVLAVGAAPDPATPQLGDADALVTDRPGVAVAVMVADCLPVLLADAERGVVGAAHAGRRGLVDGVIPATVTAMIRLGAMASAVRAYLGPAICGGCYEVGAQVQAEVSAHVPTAASTTTWGTPGVDLVSGALAQLAQAGVLEVERSGICTVEDPRFYSYRRDGVCGRFAGVVAMDRRDTP